MVSASIKYGRSDIHYLYFGKGSVNVVCLHGYGESAASFGFLQEYLPDIYSMIAIDLPFHGSTQWKEDRAFTNSDIVLIVNELFNIHGITDQSFVMMGFSMGGRIALSLLEVIPERISKLILLAPDGMKVNFWYWLATQTKIGNRLFRVAMNNPGWFLKLLKIADSFKLINKSIFKFISSYINDEHVCDQLFHRWTCMRTFKPRLKKMHILIRENQIPVRMLYGKHDRIILSKRAGKFSEGLEPLCQIHILDAGHQVLQKRYALVITKLLTV